MFKYVEEDGLTILHFAELRELRDRYAEYISNPKSYYQRKKLVGKIHSFLDWYLKYSDDIIKGKNYAPEKIARDLLRDKIRTSHQLREYLTKSIYVSRDYARYAKQYLTKKNLPVFLSSVTSFEIDLEWLIVHYEIHVRKSITHASLNSFRNKTLTPRDLYMAARTLFHIEQTQKISDLYLRDIKPVVMFQIRQLLEVYGRNILGYHAIADRHGNPPKKFTQVAWTFIKEEVKNKNSRISLPFDLPAILAINQWANDFVHTTYLYSSYIQFFVLKFLSVLFTGSAKTIRTFDKVNRTKFDIADIRIERYRSLKQDFENYLNERVPGTIVEWMPEDKTGAYILSL